MSAFAFSCGEVPLENLLYGPESLHHVLVAAIALSCRRASSHPFLCMGTLCLDTALPMLQLAQDFLQGRMGLGQTDTLCLEHEACFGS